MPTPTTVTTDASVGVLIAPGLEEVEALAVVDCLYRAGVRADLIAVPAPDNQAVEESRSHPFASASSLPSTTRSLSVTSSHGITLVCDLHLDDADLSEYTVLFLPGGMPGTVNLEENTKIREEIARRIAFGEPVAAICAAPSILAHTGFLDGRNATANPGFMKDLEMGGAHALTDSVVVDGNVFTSRGMGTAIQLGLSLVNHLLGEDSAKAVEIAIVKQDD